MPPTLILIRHAEAYHNATADWELHDPRLTPKGEQQCRDLEAHLRKNCPLATRVELIITSPMRRTMQTTLLGLDWLIASGVPVQCDAMWQENSNKPCDTGSDLSTLASEFPTLDLAAVDPRFPDKSNSTPYAFERTANRARGNACLRSLYARDEKVIAVVSHGSFLRTAISRRKFANADYRIFTFSRHQDGQTLELLEDLDTETRGGGLGRSEVGLFDVRDWDFPLESIEERE